MNNYIVENSNLGKNVKIWNNSIVFNSSIDDYTQIGSFVEVGNAKIGKYCRIGSFSFICDGVEIGDASTWTGCSHKEMQYTTAWASGQATITVNGGSFGASATVYLYVVDSDGNVNASGREIQFGETYGSSIPKLTGVKIVGGSIK